MRGMGLPPATAASDPTDATDATGASGRKAHICFVAPLTWPIFSGDRNIKVVGGAEVQQSMLARAFAAAGNQVSMVCLDYGQPDRTQVDGVTVFKAYRPKDGLPVLRFIHPRLTSMWGAMRRVDADIYYFRCASMLAGIGTAFCKLHGKRAIYAGASDVDFEPGRELIQYARDRRMFQWALRNVDAIVAQNPSQQQSCRRYYGREARLISSCYRPPSAAVAGPGGAVLWVATVRKYKRPEIFLEMARLLPHRRFVMVGGPGSDDAQSMAYYHAIAAEARALANVEFVGFVPYGDVEAQFDRGAVLVSTSGMEGFPNTYLQAWARGMPSVGMTDTGSRHEGEPVYAQVRDAREAAAEVERLLGDPAQWNESSRRCRAYFEANHSPEAVAAHYAELFAQLLRPDGAAA
jgi:glycosyltransferase involved in cell wall biosynthesis